MKISWRITCWYTIFNASCRKRSFKKGIRYNISKNTAQEITEKATEFYVNKGINKLNKTFTPSKGSEISLTNNESKDIIKVIKFLENRWTLLKRTTGKITSQEGGYLNFLRPFMTAGLSLMKGGLLH